MHRLRRSAAPSACHGGQCSLPAFRSSRARCVYVSFQGRRMRMGFRGSRHLDRRERAGSVHSGGCTGAPLSACVRRGRTSAVDECRCAVNTALPHGLLGPTTARAWPACVRGLRACVRACVACCSTHGVRACASQRRRCVIRCMLHVICILAWPCRALPCRMVIAQANWTGPYPLAPPAGHPLASLFHEQIANGVRKAKRRCVTRNKQTNTPGTALLPRLASPPVRPAAVEQVVRRSLFPIWKLPGYLLLVASRAFLEVSA